MKSQLLIILFLGGIASTSLAQVYSNKEMGKKNQSLADSLKKSEYPYVLPIWGKKVTAMGYNLPYSAGIGINYVGMNQDIIIDNLFVGFNNGEMINLDEVVRFDDSFSEMDGLSFRADIWLFPFLNIYGIGGKGKSSTSIAAGVWIPDTTNTWNEVTAFSTTANFDVTTFGFGMTPTIGVGGGFMAFDMNVAWSDVDALEKPAFSFVFGPRFGKSIKLKKEDMNVAVWVGAMRLHLKSETVGSLDLSELVETDDLQTKVDNGLAKVDQAESDLNTWWTDINNSGGPTKIEQAKYDKANEVLDKTGGLLNSIDGALNDEQSATVQYSLEKRPKDKWNFLVGSQYQYNKHWMVRVEFGMLGSRSQVLTGLQYRFGL